MVSDPRTLTSDRFGYASCSYGDPEEETIPCHLHLESPRFDKSKIYDCDTGLHPSEIGHVPKPTYPFLFHLLGDTKIILPWIDRKNSRNILVLRIIDMENCEIRDVHVKVAQMPIFKLITYDNGFDVIYGRPHGRTDPMHQEYFRASYDLDGTEVRAPMPIFEEIEQDELERSVNILYSPMNQLFPIFKGKSAGGYFFISRDQVKILGPDSRVIASKRFHTGNALIESRIFYGNNSLYIVKYDECVMQVIQIDEHLNLVRNITYEFDEERRYAAILVNYSPTFMVLTSDLADPISERIYYLETIDANDKREKSLPVGKLRFKENLLVWFYMTYSETHVCVNALSSNDLIIKGLKTACVPKADLHN
ncbi:hypothetical protein QAD02_006445 [Eretmocerus hayati]|uniref:Uncharacterized protein n=1 Tax=Eretmocerus hayati TaxID=131215 RepID=A0ACC2N1D7_9HYME|nr:hypothetical protein QAD02_006445 [Eretmocerus hayati]